jgi:hypothetical protein
VATAFIFLLGLIIAAPALVFADGLVAVGLVSLVAAVATAIVAAAIRKGEAEHLAKVVRGVWVIALVPAVIVATEFVPFPFGSFTRSVWQSAGQALGTNLLGFNTIDPGRTVIVLGRYLALVAIAVVATAVAIDRRRSERILRDLMAVSVLTALIVTFHDVGGFTFLGEITSAGGPRSAIAAAGAFGMVLSAAYLVLVIERYESRQLETSLRSTAIALGTGVVAVIASALALLLSGMLAAFFAGCCGVGTLLIIVLIRRLGLGRWAIVVIGIVAVVAAVTIVVSKSVPIDANWTMRYAMRAPPSLIAMAGRMTADVGWFGSGAGTFGALLPIYQGSDPAGLTAAPTWAAQMSIEIGVIGLWIVVLAIAVLGVLLAHGALTRGRDSFYATAGAAVVVTALIYGFVDVGLANIGISILLAALAGLAIAQSAGRTA